MPRILPEDEINRFQFEDSLFIQWETKEQFALEFLFQY